MEYLLQSSSRGEKPEVNHPHVLQMKLCALEVAQFLPLTTTSLLPHCCQPAHSCRGSRAADADAAGNNLHSTSACCSAWQTAATALSESCNSDLHGRLCSVLDGWRWYMFNTHFLLCLRGLYYIFGCTSCFFVFLMIFCTAQMPWIQHSSHMQHWRSTG